MEQVKYLCHRRYIPGCSQPLSRRETHITVSLSVPICLSQNQGPVTITLKTQDTAQWRSLHGPVPVSVRVPSITVGRVKGGRGSLLSSLREEAPEVGTRQPGWGALPHHSLLQLCSHSPVCSLSPGSPGAAWMRGRAWAGLKISTELTFPGNSDAVQSGFLEVQKQGLRDTEAKCTLHKSETLILGQSWITSQLQSVELCLKTSEIRGHKNSMGKGWDLGHEGRN